MPPSNVRKSRKKRARRGRAYLLGTLALVLIVAVGLYVYASSQSANSNPPSTGIVYARLNTSKGVIDVELYQSKTPQTVTNFVNLAKSGLYNNLVWHRIIADFVIQTGDPNTKNVGDRSTWGKGGSSQTVPLEIDDSLSNTIGYLAMARKGDDVNSGTSQFYINLADNRASLDGQYTVFGKVTSGLEVAFAIASVPTYDQFPYEDQPIEPVSLTSVTISNSP